jgi:hypothetical protein
MKKKIVFGIIFVSIILLIMPSISAVQLNLVDNLTQINENLKTDIIKVLHKLTTKPAPKWFTIFYLFIMLSLSFRIELLTPLAITPSGEYWGQYEVKSYFFCLILLTLVYRFAFWYNFFDRIIEKNNWEVP